MARSWAGSSLPAITLSKARTSGVPSWELLTHNSANLGLPRDEAQPIGQSQGCRLARYAYIRQAGRNSRSNQEVGGAATVIAGQTRAVHAQLGQVVVE